MISMFLTSETYLVTVYYNVLVWSEHFLCGITCQDTMIIIYLEDLDLFPWTNYRQFCSFIWKWWRWHRAPVGWCSRSFVTSICHVQSACVRIDSWICSNSQGSGWPTYWSLSPLQQHWSCHMTSIFCNLVGSYKLWKNMLFNKNVLIAYFLYMRILKLKL